MVWSVVVAKLPSIGFTYSTDQLFWLAALPGLSGATLRIFYSFMVPIFGGRLWTTLTTWSLIIPALGIGMAVQNPATPYWLFLALALLCGFGGGNFASSMANISFFFPKAEKGNALALNAGLGNLGVSVVQFAVPLAITAGVFGWLGGEPQTAVEAGRETKLWLQNAGFIFVPFIVASAFAAWFAMNDIASARASFAEQSVIFQRKHNWIMCWLYTGTFGSFIGYSAGFPLLAKTQFPEVNALAYAFLGPLVGALSRSLTGWVADRWGGARVTFWVFVGMAIGVAGVLYFVSIGSWPGFFAMFLVLFFVSGVGNASTFQMIPAIMRSEMDRLMPDGRCRGTRAPGGQGIGRHHRLHLGDCRLRRLLHPQELRHLHQPHRRARGGTVVLPRLLCELHRRHVVVLHAAGRAAPRHRARPCQARRCGPTSGIIGVPDMSHFLDRLTFFNRIDGTFANGHGITTREDRRWEDGYRKRWQHDKIVRSTHGANCTGSCSWKIYVKGGIVTWETQQTDYPRTRPDLPNHEPQGLLARRQLLLVPLLRQPREVSAGALAAHQAVARGARHEEAGGRLGLDRGGPREARRLHEEARARRLRARELGRGHRDHRRGQRLHCQDLRARPRVRLLADPGHVDGLLRRGLALSLAARRRVHVLLRLVLRPAAVLARRPGASRPTCPRAPTGTTPAFSSCGAPTCRRRARPTPTSTPRSATRAPRASSSAPTIRRPPSSPTCGSA